MASELSDTVEQARGHIRAQFDLRFVSCEFANHFWPALWTAGC